MFSFIKFELMVADDVGGVWKGTECVDGRRILHWQATLTRALPSGRFQINVCVFFLKKKKCYVFLLVNEKQQQQQCCGPISNHKNNRPPMSYTCTIQLKELNYQNAIRKLYLTLTVDRWAKNVGRTALFSDWTVFSIYFEIPLMNCD